MNEIGLGHYLSLGAIIFFLGVIGIFLNHCKARRLSRCTLLFSLEQAPLYELNFYNWTPTALNKELLFPFDLVP